MKYVVVFIIVLSLWVSTRTGIYIENDKRETKMIEIKGEIVNPGVYEVGYHASVKDIIDLAGGLLEGADTNSINLTKDLANESVIVVPKFSDKCISINSASIEELTTLKSVGPATAQRIIEYRETYSFQSIEDLMQVRGIKEKTFDKIKDELCL